MQIIGFSTIKLYRIDRGVVVLFDIVQKLPYFFKTTFRILLAGKLSGQLPK
jgi:hypothetical protein